MFIANIAWDQILDSLVVALVTLVHLASPWAM
jgi:hypothetical protein